jgi:DNA-binding FadR family transcriptional regulator
MQEAAAATELERWAKIDVNLHAAIRTIAANAKLAQVAEMAYPVIDRVRHLHLREGSEPKRRRLRRSDGPSFRNHARAR